MDQQRDTLGTHGRRDVSLDRQTDRPTDSAQLQQNIDDLHQTMDRLHMLQADYRALLQSIRDNMRVARALEAESTYLRSMVGTEQR